MLLARLLTATLLVATLPAIAQEKSAISPDSDSIPSSAQKLDQNVAPEPWDIFSEPFRFDSRLGHSLVYPDAQLTEDTLCYTMRSYVVARDSKNSDSVHPTGYSTCHPASRYRLRTTKIRTLKLDR